MEKQREAYRNSFVEVVELNRPRTKKKKERNKNCKGYNMCAYNYLE